MKMEFGLIGKSLGHSYSSDYHNTRFREEGINALYSNFELEDIADIKDLIASRPGLLGLNVTVPYKRSVIPFLATLHSDAQGSGAVNTIVVDGDTLIGYNTDVFGFQESLSAWIDPVDEIRALVLGTGGAFRAVARALSNLSIAYLTVSRTSGTKRVCYDDITDDVMRSHELIINTTPLGMYPDITSTPSIPYDRITSKHWVYDLVYNPEKTILLSRSELRGAHIKNGLQMLHLQADKSWKIWKLYLEQEHGRTFD
jgi:shikimate dehydrogenase